MAKLPDIDKEFQKLMPKMPRIDTAGTRKPPKRGMDVEELQGIANEVGLGEQAQQIIDSKGEEAEEFFSGGIISDIFDVLNALQFGVVGMMKGKGFMEGVRTRQSWSDKDALGEFGLPGTIAGIAADIAFDPLTYITPWTIFKRIPGLQKMGKAGMKAVGNTKVGSWLGRKFVYRFGQDPIYKELAERSIRNIGIGNQATADFAKVLSKIDGDTARALLRRMPDGSLARVPFEELGRFGLNSDQLEAAQSLWKMSDDLAERAKAVGLLGDNAKADYVANLYTKFELDPKGTFGFASPKKTYGDRFAKARKLVADDPEELAKLMKLRKEYGEITEAVYPVAKGNMQALKDVEYAELFDASNKMFASDEVVEGFVKLSDSKKLGNLKGKYVPEWLAADVNEMIRDTSSNAWKKIIGGFKFGKVILNPATHSRNIMSNFILNNFEGLNPLRMDIYADAAKELVGKGKWYKGARKHGLGLNTFASQEIKNILTGPDALGSIGKGKKAFKGALDKVADLYQKEEEFAKMAQFIFQAKKLGAKSADDLGEVIGKSIAGFDVTIGDKAFEIAERATFDYAQVTPFIRKVRESVFGMPFVTFTAKATPQVAKTLVKAPGKISWIGKVKNGIENMADLKELKKERASEPQWIKDGFYVKLPMKDKHNRSAYFDLTYIIPFGDMISGQILERQVDRETGLPESMAESVLKKAPVINLITELGKNQDFYGNKIWRASDSQDKQMADLFRHIAKTYLPPLVGDTLPGGHVTKGRKAGQRRAGIMERASQAKEGTQYRTFSQEALRNVGMKIQPVDADINETYKNYETKKALETMLTEHAEIGQFQRAYRTKK